MSSPVRMVYCAFPCYGKPHPHAARQFWARSVDPSGPYKDVPRVQDDAGSSLLGNSFDSHWATALNFQASGQPVTHFAMLHSDIVPQDWWLDQLLHDLQEAKADVCAAVVPIKDARGLTSTAIDNPNDGWDVLRRLTLQEVARLPEVFTAADCGYPDNLLLANTGCWVCDFTRPWRFRVNFEIRNRIVYKTKEGEVLDPSRFYRTYPPDGKWQTQVRPEDWEFSRKVGRLGGKVICTRRVKLTHPGELPWPNAGDWGKEATDSVFARNFATPVASDVPLIDGWLSEAEGRALAEAAVGKDVLEVGSYKGLSTVWLARTARQVTAVDTFDGRATPKPGSTFDEFQNNLYRCGVYYKVAVHIGHSQFVLPVLSDASFDLVFIDGDHDYGSVCEDVRLSLRLLRPGGVLALHDYGRPEHPGVSERVNEMLHYNRATLSHTVGSVVFLHPVSTVPIDRACLPKEQSNGTPPAEPAGEAASATAAE
jgi:predicted O-methyltransferase YrrM